MTPRYRTNPFVWLVSLSLVCSRMLLTPDQVGNVRLSFYKGAGGAAEIDRVTNYYPFGLEFNENIVPVHSMTQNYRYSPQGQEKQEDTKWSSFKWRNYDPTIGRFFNVDPLSEKYAYQSYYNFSENRVVDAKELEGLEAKLIKELELSISSTGVKYSAPEYELRANVKQGSLTNTDVANKFSIVANKFSIVENNFKSEGLNLTIIQDSKATYTIDMSYKGKSVVVNNSDGTTTRGTVLGDAPQGDPITATVNVKNGDPDTLTHEIGHTFGLPHIWEPNSGAANIKENSTNLMNSYENPITSVKGLGKQLNDSQLGTIHRTIRFNEFRLKENKDNSNVNNDNKNK